MPTESVAGTAMWLDGIEILNDARTVAYLRNQLGPPGISVNGDCGCPNLIDIIDCDTSYVSPTVDQVPWLSSYYEESADFLGFLVSDFNGLGSTFTRDVIDVINEGAVLGRLRAGQRTLTWRVYLVGRTCCSVAYGLRWLNRQLSGPTSCASGCTTSTLDLLVCCPETPDNDATDDPGATVTGPVGGGYAAVIYSAAAYAGPDETTTQTDVIFPPKESVNDRAFRTLYNVGLVEGPTIVDQRRVDCGCGGAEVLQVEFTLVAGKPWLYQNPISIANELPLSFGVSTEAFDECTAEALDCTTNPNCPPPSTPPTPGLTDNCFSEIIVGTVTRISVPRAYWPDVSDVVPIIKIYSGTQAMGSTILDFYQSSSGDPCGELIGLGAIACNPVCGTLKIPFIPADSTLVIDGRINRMSLICANRASIQPGEKLTSGEWGWPVFSCFGFCFELITEQTVLNANATVSLELVPRSM